MTTKVTARYLRVPPRKARMVAALVSGKGANEASAILRFVPRKGAHMLGKVLKSAISNVTSSNRVDADQLFVKNIQVDPGPVMKRNMSRAHGRATPKNRRMSHITVVLGQR